MANELYHYGRKGMKWYQHIFTSKEEKQYLADRQEAIRSNRSDIAFARRAQEIICKNEAPKFEARRIAEKKLSDYIDEQNDRAEADVDNEGIEKLGAEYQKAYRESAWPSAQLGYIDVYIRKLSGEPYRFLDSEWAEEGRKIVESMVMDKKYYNDFWDENGKFRYVLESDRPK